MPYIRVLQNDRELCVAGSDVAWMVSVYLTANLWGKSPVSFDVTGGTHPDASNKTNMLIWEVQRDGARGDSFRFDFLENDSSRPAPEVYVSDLPDELELTADDLEAYRTRHDVVRNLDVALTLSCSSEEKPISVSPTMDRQHVSFMLLWHASDGGDELVRVSLSRSSTGEVEERLDKETLLWKKLPVGASFEITVT